MKKMIPVLIIFLFTPAVTMAAYQMDDSLGQLDESRDARFEASLRNNTPGDRLYRGEGRSAIDTVNNRLFVSDETNSRVLVFDLDSSNELVDPKADAVLGQNSVFQIEDRSFPPATVTRSEMLRPSGLAYDPDTNYLYVVDREYHRVLVFDVATITPGESAAHVLGETSSSISFFGDTTQSKMDNPRDVYLDTTNDRLFVSDTDNNRIMIFDVSSITDGENAIHVLGQDNFTDSISTSTPPGASEGQSKFSSPRGLAYDSSTGYLYVTDFNNNRVMVFDVNSITDGEDAIHVLGQSDYVSDGTGSSAGALNDPQGVDIDSNNDRLFVADYSNNRVLVYDVSTIADGEDAVNVLGQADLTSNTNDLTTQSSLDGPWHPTYNSSSDKLYVHDQQNNRIMIFDVSSITDGENAVDLIAGWDDNFNLDYTTERTFNDPNTYGLREPYDMAVDETNNKLYVSDNRNHRVLIFNLTSDHELEDRSADYVIGQSDFTSNNFDVTATSLFQPTGISIDEANSRLFVADSRNNRVMVFDVSTLSNGPTAINVLGQSNFTSDNAGTDQESLDDPRGVSYDPDNDRLFVADSDDNRVMIFDVATISNGESAVSVLGQSNFSSNSSDTSQSGLSEPMDVLYVTGQSKLYVSDYGNNRVLVYDTSSLSDGQAASNVIGQADFTSSASATDSSSLISPMGLSYKSSDELLHVGDSGNNRIMIFDTSSLSDGMAAQSVLGQDDFSSSESGTSQELFASQSGDSMAGLEYDNESKRLYVADMFSHRVVAYDFVDIDEADLPDGNVGEAYSESLSADDSQGTVTWTLESGSLPSGLTISGNTISGTPSAIGSSTLTFSANDEITDGVIEFSDQAEISITVAEAPAEESEENSDTGSSSSGSRKVTQDEYNSFQNDDNEDGEEGGVSTGQNLTREELEAQIFNLQATVQSLRQQINSRTGTNFVFTRDLYLGMEGEDVRRLQEFLNSRDFVLAQRGPGSAGNETDFFGVKTKAAVKKFQEAYHEDILEPVGLVVGSGYFGESTRKQVRRIMNQLN